MRILYIDIDSLRPDHLGCHGYCRNTSPVIDEIAAQGVRFSRCYTTDAPCLPSRTALFCGRPGIQNGVVSHEGPGASYRWPGEGHDADPSRAMWMEVLQRNGWQTASFSSFARRHFAWWFTAGFSEYHGHQLTSGLETADEVNALALPWLEANAAREKWFLHVNYWDVHTPYRAPAEWFERMAAQPVPDWPDQATIERHGREWYGPRTPRDYFGSIRDGRSPFPSMPDAILNRDDFAAMCNGYDAAVGFVDQAIGQLLETLERAGVLDETVIIISADHGEAVGEQGMYFEHGNASEGVCHVPLIVRWPGMARGTVCDAMLAQLDLPATVLDALGLEPPGAWEGRSFLPALRGDAFAGRDEIIWGCGIYAFQRAVRTRDWLFVRTLHPGVFPHEPMYLFDMQQDPWQQNNLAQERPEMVAALDHRLSRWWHGHCTGLAAVPDPMLQTLPTGPNIYCNVERTEWMIQRAGREDQLEDLRRRQARAPFRYRPGP